MCVCMHTHVSDISTIKLALIDTSFVMEIGSRDWKGVNFSYGSSAVITRLSFLASDITRLCILLRISFALLVYYKLNGTSNVYRFKISTMSSTSCSLTH